MGPVEVRPLARRTLGAVHWALAGQIVALILQLPYTAVMSRLLSPADFGVVSLAAVVLRLISYFAQMGIQSALVQAPCVDHPTIRRAQSRALTAGAAGLAAMAVISLVIYFVLHRPLLGQVLLALSLDLVISAIGVTGLAQLRRELDFKRISLIESFAFAAGYLGIGIASANAGLGVWSLVTATLGGSSIRAAGYMVLSRTPLKPVWRGPRATDDVRSFGVKISRIYFLEYWTGSADTLTIGFTNPASIVGIYTRGTMLVWLPVQQVGVALSRVLLTSLREADESNVGRVLTNGLILIAAGLVPVTAIFVADGRFVVSLLLGSQWGAVIALLPPLATAAIINTVSQLPSVGLEARGHLDVRLRIQVFQTSFLISALATVAALGCSPRWYAMAWASSEILRQALFLVACSTRYRVAAMEVIRSYAWIAVSTIPAVLVTHLLDSRGGISRYCALVGGIATWLAISMAWKQAPWRRAARELRVLHHLALPSSLASAARRVVL